MGKSVHCACECTIMRQEYVCILNYNFFNSIKFIVEIAIQKSGRSASEHEWCFGYCNVLQHYEKWD